jgi:sugar phosphate isomerase/epimerase
MPKRVSLQLYSARNSGLLAETLATLARIGYREVEGFGGVYDDPAAVRGLLDEHGLAMPTGHIGLELLEKDRKRAIRIATTLGMRHIFVPYIPESERPSSVATWKALARRLTGIGHWVRSEGFTFGWHNHDFEFIKLRGGAVPIDILFESAPLLDWECDVAWVARSGASPMGWIRKYRERITAVHIKDIAAKGQNPEQDGWADVGTGRLPWRAILHQLVDSRTLHFVIEHDRPGDFVRFARRSYAFVTRN